MHSLGFTSYNNFIFVFYEDLFNWYVQGIHVGRRQIHLHEAVFYVCGRFLKYNVGIFNKEPPLSNRVIISGTCKIIMVLSEFFQFEQAPLLAPPSNESLLFLCRIDEKFRLQCQLI